jgi:hypothetical protein
MKILAILHVEYENTELFLIVELIKINGNLYWKYLPWDIRKKELVNHEYQSLQMWYPANIDPKNFMLDFGDLPILKKRKALYGYVYPFYQEDYQ